MLAAGPWDESSLRDIRDDSIDRLIGYYIDRDDMVTTVMSTFASTTVHCARCHDHKFDPISQEDYYGLQAVFAGVDKAERGYDKDPALDRLRRRQKAELKETEPKRTPAGGVAESRAGGLASSGFGICGRQRLFSRRQPRTARRAAAGPCPPPR